MIKSVKRWSLSVAVTLTTLAAGVILPIAPAQAAPADSSDAPPVTTSTTRVAPETLTGLPHTSGSDSVSPLISYCGTGRVAVTTSYVYIYEEATFDSGMRTVGFFDDEYNCTGYVLGERYTMCGVSNGNGWLIIPFGNPVQYYGFAPQACFNDA